MNVTGFYVIGFGGVGVIGTRSGIGNSGDISLGYIIYRTVVKMDCDDKVCMDLFHNRFQCKA
jgi:hypothetical protein